MVGEADRRARSDCEVKRRDGVGAWDLQENIYRLSDASIGPYLTIGSSTYSRAIKIKI